MCYRPCPHKTQVFWKTISISPNLLRWLLNKPQPNPKLHFFAQCIFFKLSGLVNVLILLPALSFRTWRGVSHHQLVPGAGDEVRQSTVRPLEPYGRGLSPRLGAAGYVGHLWQGLCAPQDPPWQPTWLLSLVRPAVQTVNNVTRWSSFTHIYLQINLDKQAECATLLTDVFIPHSEPLQS